MTGLSLILLFVVTIAAMIVIISRFKVHPFISIMTFSLLFGLIAGIPLVDKMVDGEKIPGIATVTGQGFSGTFTSIGVVIILGAFIGSILETTGAALKFADIIIRAVGKKHPVPAMEMMGWVVSIAVFCDSGFETPERIALVCMAIGAGAMTVSHANDSYFWVVTNFGSLSPELGYKVQSLGTLILGLSAMVEIYILSIIL